VQTATQGFCESAGYREVGRAQLATAKVTHFESRSPDQIGSSAESSMAQTCIGSCRLPATITEESLSERIA
jgi:hypothetical protein